MTYAGFSEGVLCDFTIPTDLTPFTTTKEQITFCDGNAVRICNSSGANKCANFTKAQLLALPRSRAIGYQASVNVAAHYKYVAGASYTAGDIVVTTNAAGVKAYYKLSQFDPFSS